MDGNEENTPIRKFNQGNLMGQRIWRATAEDIKILRKAPYKYPLPIEMPGTIVIRIVRLSEPVTSPISRAIANAQFGIREDERWRLLFWGFLCSGVLCSAGLWQLYRMKWKADLIEKRRSRLSMPMTVVTGSPFPWTDDLESWAYRLVELRGVYDLRREMKVGPRPGLSRDKPGYNIVCPLVLEDGTRVLINRGHINFEYAEADVRREIPEWLSVRAVIDPGEIPNFRWLNPLGRLKNRPDDNMFHSMRAEDLAQRSGAPNIQACSQAVLNAFDAIYDEDKYLPPNMRRRRFTSEFDMKGKKDYLLFWADEFTHFNYAMQWFGMAALAAVMTVSKFIQVSRWRF